MTDFGRFLGRTRRAWLSAWALGFSGAALGGAADTIPIGAPGFLKTALSGQTIESIDVSFLGTLENYLGPRQDLHLIRLEGPIAERIGVASGMSGSPVYFDGKLIGALAYRFGAFPKDAVAGVTPIESMLDASRELESAVPVWGDSFRPIATPVVASGLTPGARTWLSERMRTLGFDLGAGAGVSGGESSPAVPLLPGSPVGVQLVRGDLRLAATGTVTWVDGGKVYAFGHPFFGAGRSEMPLVSAEVAVTLGDWAGSAKLSRIGDEIGAVVDDRLPAIVARLDRRARMIPVTIDLSGGGYERQRFQFEIVREPAVSPFLAGVTLINALESNTGFERDSTIVVDGRVQLTGLPDLTIDLAEARRPGVDVAPAVASGLVGVLSALREAPFPSPDVSGIELQVAVTSDARRYRIEGIQADRRPVRPGELLELRVELSMRPAGSRAVEHLELRVPRSLVPGQRIGVWVGAAGEVDRALGDRVRQRLGAARDAPTFVRALGEAASSRHLRAVLVEREGAVSSRGVMLDTLPPTAERLFSAARPGAAPRSSREPSILDDRRRTLDGPIEGILGLTLQVESGSTGSTDPDDAPPVRSRR